MNIEDGLAIFGILAIICWVVYSRYWLDERTN